MCIHKKTINIFRHPILPNPNLPNPLPTLSPNLPITTPTHPILQHPHPHNLHNNIKINRYHSSSCKIYPRYVRYPLSTNNVNINITDCIYKIIKTINNIFIISISMEIIMYIIDICYQ
jgi:hypothetical protein